MKPNYDYLVFEENISTIRSNSVIAGNYDFHLHNSYEVYLFLKGDTNYFVEHSCYHLSRGNILVFNNHEIHKTTNLTDMPHERAVLHFDPRLARQLSTTQTNLLSCFQNHEPGIGNMAKLNETQLETYLSLYNKLERTLASDGYGDDVLPTTYLIQMLVMINDIYHQMELSPPSIISSKLNPVLLYIDEHITTDLSLDKIANALSMSKFYLSHIFEIHTGSKLYQYILIKRIAIAKQYLAKGYNVTETCQLSGFNDYANFIRTFKKITGLPPGRYAKLLHKEM
jgi:AraC-type DNA-binding domain-containing proteins